jgi:hypothetical protein
MAALVSGIYVLLPQLRPPSTGQKVARPAHPSVQGPLDLPKEPVADTSIASVPDGAAAEKPIALPSIAAAVGPLNPWSVRYRESQDYFQFVSDAAMAAEAGDGRAALHLSRVVELCTHFTEAYRKEVDPEVAFLTGLADMIGAEKWVHEAKLEEFRRCARFFDESPFVSLPQRPGGYSSQYWRELADGTDDPLVKALHAWRDSGNYPPADPSAAESMKERIEANLRSAIVSKDPEALYSAGTLLANGPLSADPLRGIAWMILACEGGYNCSAQNLEHTYAFCAQIGSCPADAPWPYYFEQRLGREGYARAYQMAQGYAALVARGDWDRLEHSWKLDSRREPQSFVQGVPPVTVVN